MKFVSEKSAEFLSLPRLFSQNLVNTVVLRHKSICYSIIRRCVFHGLLITYNLLKLTLLCQVAVEFLKN